MKDAYVNAVNIQAATRHWMNATTENLVNRYTPGYRENQVTFKTFLDAVQVDGYLKNPGQGKAVPGTSTENVYLEGNGFFVTRNDEGRIAYTRLGEFKFDSQGVYKASDGSKVQGYILNDHGEIMSGSKAYSSSEFEQTTAHGGALSVPTTEIKLWIDPDNGKYLGKYDEYEIKGDGILYGKSNSGKDMTPLYKISVMNFHNPQELYQYKEGHYVETAESGRPVVGKAEISSGMLEVSNVDFTANAQYYAEAKAQMELSNKLISSYKQLLQNALQLLD